MRIHRHRRFKRQLEIERQTFRANERIRIPEVRVVDDQGENLGTMPTAQALTMARERGLDLVEVAPKAQPPVCRFIDFKQFRYEQEKIRRQQKTRAKKVEVKGVRLSLRIGEHDRQLRLRQAKGFFDEGNRVAVEIILRGRERQYGNLAREVIMKFVDDLKLEYDITIDQPLSVQGGRFSLAIGGKKHGTPDAPETDEEEDELDFEDDEAEDEQEAS
ncbi:translation initiation factor IF-3 [Candidatus Uhrbacteria bacterium]|nr:translation initiation factor IF-3 [Candidatus Uhrbacteria bacterium]